MKIRTPLFVVFSLFIAFVANGQSAKFKTTKIKGTVTNFEGFPIHKAYVFVDSLNSGFRTNKNGEYKLRIPVGTDLLSIFSEEYGIHSEVFDNQEKIDFVFPDGQNKITEEELKKLGYIFDSEIFRNLGKKSFSEYTDIFQIIREKFTGVTVSGTSILVRGIIGGDQTPLFVVDGNYVSSIANINPDELKSIELLKGEDSALYGSRGAPGVFIITLK